VSCCRSQSIGLNAASLITQRSSWRKPLGQYLRDNFFIATSGNFHTVSLLACIEQIGIERIMFAVDYPYEEMHEAVAWFDNVPLDEAERRQIARTKAERLFRLA
jgi:predicted TIM-barrel fold metal-dependent hydrolase